MGPHQILQELNTSVEYVQVQRLIINHATNEPNVSIILDSLSLVNS